MVTIESKQNVYLNRVKHTIFVIREASVFVGQYSIVGWDASDAACLSVYNAFKE